MLPLICDLCFSLQHTQDILSLSSLAVARLRFPTVEILLLATISQLVHTVDFQLTTDYRVRIRVTLRLAVYRQSVRLSARPLQPHDHRFFFTEPFPSYPFCDILPGERIGLSLMNKLGLCQVYVSHM
jgi:hypothetical protein